MTASKQIIFLTIGASFALHFLLYLLLSRHPAGLDESRHHALVEIGYVEVVQHAAPVNVSHPAAPPRPNIGRRETQKSMTTEVGSAPSSVEVSATEASPIVSDTERNEALAHYIADVRTRIDHAKVYPPTASEREQEGSVTIGLSLDRAGHITKYTVESPSPYRLLNEAAERAVRGAQFIKFPSQLEGEELHLHIPVAFRIDHK